MKPLEAIRCTHPSCPCECFAPGKTCLRYCDSCNHGWVAHALDKLGYQHVYNLGMQVEVVQPNIVFDIASLMLYGAQATPVRLKILLDRLFSVLQHEEVLQVLHGFGWSYEDYARGYILQDTNGRVLDKWSMATRDEEHVILQQFLRFGETKAIAQEIILQDTRDKQDAYSKQTSRAESEIKKFIERSNLSMQSFMTKIEPRQIYGGRLPFMTAPGGARILTSPIIPPTAYSPSKESTARPLSLTTSPAASSTPLSTPPMGRLQSLQPYEFARRDHSGGTSPAPSPSSSDKTSSAPVPAAVTVSAAGVVIPSVVAAAAAARGRSPVVESPRNLSTTPSSVHSAPSPSVTPHKPQSQEGGDMSGPGYSDSEDDQSVGAIDYSTRDDPDSPQDPGKAAARHMRKSNNPIKRQWIPSAGFGSTFVGPNGKKRVLCTACNKTFCDKGALKIHYSAVHLKEMHKCTVDGCNMMFSSRRSRNRHSANPNPKLHMPQKRKDLPDVGCFGDDEKAPSLSTSLSSSPTMVVGAPLVAAHRSVSNLDASGLLRADPAYFMELRAQFPFIAPPDKRIKLEAQDTQDGPTDLSSNSGAVSERMEVKEDGEEMEQEDEKSSPVDLKTDQMDTKDNAGMEGETEGLAEDDAAKVESSVQKASGNRRKSNAPTRCAQKDEAVVLIDTLEEEGRDPSLIRARKEGGRRVDNFLGVDTTASDSHNDQETVEDEAGAGSTDKKSTGAVNFPNIASLLLASKEQAEVDDDCSESKLVINGDVDNDDNEADKAMSDDNTSGDHNHNSVPRAEGEDGSESCGSDSADGVDCSNAYIDKENPRKCALCGKLFQNQFSVKIHFQNVHLKLMHSCTVDGCSAAFPSKRSRDRHSSNLNLHRKMLSGGEATALDTNTDPTLRNDILSTLYSASHLASGAIVIQADGNLESDPKPADADTSESKAEDGEMENTEETNNEEVSEVPEEVVTDDKICMSNGYTKDEAGEEGETEEGEEVGEEEQEQIQEETAGEEVGKGTTAPGGGPGGRVFHRGELTMAKKPVCCGMTFHTEAALKEHYDLRHPTQSPAQLKTAHAAAPDTLLANRRPRNRPNRHRNGLHRLITTGRKNGFS